MFDWNDLRCFLAVARHGSTLAAAKALCVSQSTVHRRLVALEKSLAQQIVVRRPTGYELTEAGRALLPQAERVEDAATALARQASGLETAMTGIVRLTCPEAFGSRLVHSNLLDRFHRRFPGLQVELITSTKPLDLSRGEADIAIRAVEPMDERLFGRKIADAPWCIYAAPSYVARHGVPKKVEEINNHAVIVLEHHHSAAWIRSNAPQARVAATANNIAALVLIARSGAGLSALPIMVGDPDDELVRVLGPVKGFNTTFHVLMHEDLKQTPRVRAFFDFIIDELPAIRPLFTGEARREKKQKAPP